MVTDCIEVKVVHIFAILGHFMVFSICLHLEKMILHFWTSRTHLKPLQNYILNLTINILWCFSRKSVAPRKL